MSRFSVCFCAAAVAALATAAFGDILDPALAQTAVSSDCGGSYWCASINPGTLDPNTGDSTLEFVMSAGIPSFTLGWVAEETGSTAVSYTHLDVYKRQKPRHRNASCFEYDLL